MSNAPELPARSPTVPGSVLAGKYRVERVLGQGGMGVVVEARHIALDERVALKFLLPEYAKHPEASLRFLREARNSVKIKSEHVARVSDVGTLDESGAPYMVMEYLEGRDLAGVLEKSGVIGIPDAVDYVIQGCEAIAEAHGYGIVHRDLKPANLFLTSRPDGTPLVKVLDFGISKGGSTVDNLTRTTAALGSALYMSPEQMQATRSVDHRTDIYALGVSLYELLAGKQPFFADTLPQLCAEILTGTPAPLRSVRPDVSEALANVIQRAYARDRGQRYQSVAEFVVALAPFAPSRSQGTIERVARMGGLPIPTPASSSGIFPAVLSYAPQQGVPLGGTPLGVPQTPPAQAAPAPVLAPAPPPAPPQSPGGTVQLPVMDPTTGQGAPVAMGNPAGVPQTPPANPGGVVVRPSPTAPMAPVAMGNPVGVPQTPPPAVPAPPALPAPRAPSPSQPDGPPLPLGAQQILPGHYSAPMSVRAAASFAQGASTNAGLSTTGAGNGKASVFFAVLGMGVLLLCAGLALAFNLSRTKGHLGGASTAPAATMELAAPSTTVETLKPLDVKPLDVKPVDTARPVETVKPAETSSPTGKGPGGRRPGAVQQGQGQGQVTPPPGRPYDPNNPL